MRIFDYEDYKKLVSDRLKEYPNGGRGVMKKMADTLRVPPSTLSQVFNGGRDVTFEQAIEIANFLGLAELETDFFLLLVEKRRAGNARLKNHVEKKIERIRADSKTLKKRLQADSVLGENEKATYLSEWYFSAIKNAIRLENTQVIPEISSKLGLPLKRVQEVLDFLIKINLAEEMDGRYKMLPGRVFVDSDDPLIFRHHQNWRAQALRRFTDYPQLDPNEFSTSMQFAINESALHLIKEELLQVMVRINKIMDESKGDDRLAYINIDLHEIFRK